MIQHIVLFKLKHFSNEAEKQDKMKEIKNKLEALLLIIPELKSIHVGLNINPAEQWDIVLITGFESLKDLEIYANHPEHVAINKNIITPVRSERACVDFTTGL